MGGVSVRTRDAGQVDADWMIVCVTVGALICQLEVESWLGRRSFSLKELSKNGNRVSSSLESKSKSAWPRGAEGEVVRLAVELLNNFQF